MCAKFVCVCVCVLLVDGVVVVLRRWHCAVLVVIMYCAAARILTAILGGACHVIECGDDMAA